MRTVTSQFRHERGRSAFSLAELLIVIAVIAVLAALLLPSVLEVRSTAYMTRCQANLHAIWDAYGVWRSEHDGRLLNGGSWTGRLLPYVEYNLEVFKCPSRVASTYGLPGYDHGAMDSTSEEAQEFIADDEEWGSYNEPDPVDACFEFEIYWQVGWNPNNPNYTPGTHQRSNDLAYVIPLDGHPWVRRTDQGNRVMYEVDDEGSTGGQGRLPTYDDITFYIYYSPEGQPESIEIVNPKDSSSMRNKYFADFLVNGEVFITNWQDNIGLKEDFVFKNPDDGTGGGYTVRWNPKTQQYEKYSQPLLVLGDYALSRGSYERSDGSLVHGMDATLILILDFGYSKAVADFNMGGTTEDVWDQYFFTDVREWERDFPDCATKGWQSFQSLRHFEKANVLFCDGSVRPTGVEELYYGSPLWFYEGR